MPMRFPRAWYAATITDFLSASPAAVLGELAANSDLSDRVEQRDAWRAEIALLREALDGLCGEVFIEFTIPRMGHRADAVLLLGPAVFVLEFKVEAAGGFDRSAILQVWDYALDLKHFHKASHEVPIVPVLVVPQAPDRVLTLRVGRDKVFRPCGVNAAGLRPALEAILAELAAAPVTAIGPVAWRAAPYYPSPTIVDAARALYANHTVAEIACSEAGENELAAASNFLRDRAREARDERRKVICFLTGVPGAGKTLVGLDLATDGVEPGQPHAVFLSGNGPLVAVLREALIRDERLRRAHAPPDGERKPVAQSVKEFIQNVYEFRKQALLQPDDTKAEHVAIFDEAQRAWNREKLAAFLARRMKIHGSQASEPEVLISTLDHLPDWAMIICLVGEGQEINSGEAGIGEWFRALVTRFPAWEVYAPPPSATNKDVAAAWQQLRGRPGVHADPRLHLRVSVRSFRAENLSAFVEAVLDCELERARQELERLRGRYPVVLTRDLSAAKQWVREQAQGSERYGLLATSKAQRLRPLAVNVRAKCDPVHWFLDGPDDIRSSYYLEEVATEFEVQGLELDWACVAWDGDLRRSGE
ncbi:MAG TPA: DNA/RNA helicase domain-containing protein, partial [Terriglobales bacterium]